MLLEGATPVAASKGHIPDAFLLLQEQGYRLIYLYRRNILKSIVSHLNSLRLREKFPGMSNAVSEDQVMGQIEVDLPAFDYLLKFRKISESLHHWFFDNFAGDKIKMSYEELLEDEAAFSTRTLRFIGVEQQQLHGAFYKNTPDTLREAVTNYAEFAAKFQGTEYAGFLD